MIRVFDKPVYDIYWENIPLLATVYIIEKNILFSIPKV